MAIGDAVHWTDQQKERVLKENGVASVIAASILQLIREAAKSDTKEVFVKTTDYEVRIKK